MQLVKELDRRDVSEIGQELHRFATELYPVCRSITGDGIRKTLALIQTRIPLEMFEVPTGTPVFDWTIPKEWNIRDAYIRDSSGKKIVDFKQHNLHVLNYSTPIHATMSLADLKPHLLPFRTIPNGFRIGLRTIRRTGDSVCRIHRCWRSRKGNTRYASIPALKTATSATASAFFRGVRVTRCSSRVMHVILRSQMTTSLA